jgi:hypothetical protein
MPRAEAPPATDYQGARRPARRRWRRARRDQLAARSVRLIRFGQARGAKAFGQYGLGGVYRRGRQSHDLADRRQTEIGVGDNVKKDGVVINHDAVDVGGETKAHGGLASEDAADQAGGVGP